MAIFEFKARDEGNYYLGKEVEGEIEAVSEEDARRRIRLKGLLPTKVTKTRRRKLKHSESKDMGVNKPPPKTKRPEVTPRGIKNYNEKYCCLDEIKKPIGPLSRIINENGKVVQPMPLQEIKVDSVKKKVYLDLFADPTTIIPVGIGLTLLIGSWAIGGPSYLSFVGFCTILAGVGTLVSRLIFGLENIAKNAQEFVTNAQKNNEEFRLNQLDEKLKQDGDSRTDKSLQELRNIRDGFNKAVEEGKITGAAKGLMVEKMNTLFEACVKQLSMSYDIYESTLKLRGMAKTAANDGREKVIEDVQKTIELMGSVLQQCFAAKSENENENLASLRQELQQSLEIAKNTDKQMKEFGDKPVYKKEDFE